MSKKLINLKLNFNITIFFKDIKPRFKKKIIFIYQVTNYQIVKWSIWLGKDDDFSAYASPPLKKGSTTPKCT